MQLTHCARSASTNWIQVATGTNVALGAYIEVDTVSQLEVTSDDGL